MGGKYIVYILVSTQKINWSYVGYTKNITRRFLEHTAGKTKSTKAYRPLKIIHMEYFFSQEDARSRELYLKSGFGREEKKSIIRNSYSEIV